MLLTGIAIVLLITLIAAIATIGADRLDQKTYYELIDISRSIQQELLFAAELRDGYTRTIVIPESINGNRFEITTGSTSATNSYFIVTFKEQELIYIIPPVNGSLATGINHINKKNNTIHIWQ